MTDSLAYERHLLDDARRSIREHDGNSYFNGHEDPSRSRCVEKRTVPSSEGSRAIETTPCFSSVRNTDDHG